jgi:hypothetical protein
VIEVDPRIEQTFAEVLARSRHRSADISDRLAAHERALAERSAQLKQEGQQLTQDLDRQVAEKLEQARNNPWQNRESKPTVLAFGGEDEDTRKPAPAQPVTPPAAAWTPPPQPKPAPEPEPAPSAQRFLSFEVEEDEAETRRPAPTQPQPTRPARAANDDEDDDYSGRSWVR